jgi:hypothetical protein
MELSFFPPYLPPPLTVGFQFSLGRLSCSSGCLSRSIVSMAGTGVVLTSVKGSLAFPPMNVGCEEKGEEEGGEG